MLNFEAKRDKISSRNNIYIATYEYIMKRANKYFYDSNILIALYVGIDYDDLHKWNYNYTYDENQF